MNTLTVLIVDDSENDALLLARVLKRGGYDLVFERVETADTMLAALQQRSWDLVIADYSMPHFSGIAAIELLHQLNQGIPIILVSGTIGEEVAVNAVKAGANDYVMKDNLTRLVPAVQRELQEAQLRRAQRASEEQLRKLSRAVEQSPVSVIITDTHGTIDYVNPRFSQTTGYSESEVRGRNAGILKSGMTPGTTYETLWETIHSGAEWKGELQNRKRGGELYWVAASISPIHSQDGVITHFIAVEEDITERKRHEDDLRRRTEELAAITRVGREITSTRDLDQIFTTIARNAAKLTAVDASGVFVFGEAQQLVFAGGYGVSPALIAALTGEAIDPNEPGLGQAISEKQPRQVPDTLELPDHPLASAYAAEGIRAMLAVPMWRDEEIGGSIVLWHREPRTFAPQIATFIQALAQQCVHAVENARLFAKEEQRAAEFARALEQQQELDRLKDRFIQNVSHELRTPMAIARGYAELLEAGDLGELAPNQRDPIAIIARRLRMLSHLVDDINAILEVETKEPDFEWVDLAGLVRSLVDDFRIPTTAAGIALTSSVPEDLPATRGDSIHLRRMLDNLLGNALKFTPEGGTIDVNLAADETLLTVTVADSGIGIPDDKLDRIFERFYQVDGSMSRRYGGTGLGLALVKQIAERHGGDVSVESAVGKGSTFTVRLPVFEEE